MIIFRVLLFWQQSDCPKYLMIHVFYSDCIQFRELGESPKYWDRTIIWILRHGTSTNISHQQNLIDEWKWTRKLDTQLCLYRDRNKAFGGCSIIFGGDFRQLTRGHDSKLLYSSNSTQLFEDNLTGTLILDNEHRFSYDPEFGKLLKRLWSGKLSQQDRHTTNKKIDNKNRSYTATNYQFEDQLGICMSNKQRTKHHISRGFPWTHNENKSIIQAMKYHSTTHCDRRGLPHHDQKELIQTEHNKHYTTSYINSMQWWQYQIRFTQTCWPCTVFIHRHQSHMCHVK